MSGATRCNYCPREVMASEARLSLRACGEVLCWACRRRKYPAFPNAHAAPKGCVVRLRPSGYGRFECDLITPAGTFTAGAMTDHEAIARARRQAVQAGAIAG